MLIDGDKKLIDEGTVRGNDPTLRKEEVETYTSRTVCYLRVIYRQSDTLTSV